MSNYGDNEENDLKNIISEVVELFVFPDGCLDLGRDEQEAFIGSLYEKISKFISEKQDN